MGKQLGLKQITKIYVRTIYFLTIVTRLFILLVYRLKSYNVAATHLHKKLAVSLMC